MTTAHGAADEPPGSPDRLLDGRYELGPLIAQGGMSWVYRGVDRRLDRPVAIKVMRSEFATDPSFLSRFEREARSAAALHHPGVVAVYDQGRDGDTVFLVMELVDGGTLRDLVHEQGALSVPVALSILEPMLSALGAAHEAGLLHRDIKPENVLISSRGEVKIADFGLVRAVTSTTMATGDVILGTVAYLSPEQVSTGFADARSDVYAAGIVAFEMLAGAPPFTGDNAISVAYQHVHSDVPPPSDRAPGVPAPLDDIIVRATARNASERPADAAALLSELIRMRARLMIRRVPVPVPTPRPAPQPARQPVAVGPRGTQQIAPATPGGTLEDGPPVASRATEATERVSRREPPPPPDPAVRQRRRRRRRMWIVAILVFLLAAAAATTGWWLGSGRYAYVPPLRGTTQEAAEQAVRDADLVPVVTNQHDDSVPTGRVISVNPPEGDKQLRGSQITVVVSSGRPAVPQIDPGTAAEDAIAALAAAGLTGAVDESKAVYDPAVPAGMVVATDPAAGTQVAIGTPVTLVVSKGKQPVTVPPVVDKSVVDATNALKVAGLTVSQQVNQFDPARKAGIVIGTVPAAGATVDAGAGVELVVSNSLEVPAVTGSTQTDAAAALGTAGFTVKIGEAAFDPNVDGGNVISTKPTAGALVDPADATVTVTASNAITMPELIGEDLDTAAQQLTDAGLYVQVTTFFGLGSTVNYQDPSPGTRVEPGSTVQLSSLG